MFGTDILILLYIRDLTFSLALVGRNVHYYGLLSFLALLHFKSPHGLASVI